ncbi:MAG: hypothetical protein M1830_007774 [Pleopsidium flavum]|nr:MAG: hypothetical protein M1830_007774 [Pleopsidium flavum]
MPGADVAISSRSSSPEPLTRLPFPPSQITVSPINFRELTIIRSYRGATPKARLIPLTPSFLSYLREDGIVLPSDNDSDYQPSIDTDSGIFSAEDDSEDEEALLDPSVHFRDIHLKIKETIAELGGKVTPKLNWSAPKDATWIAATNSMECRTPSDIYLLLKSSDFITHDLEHAFDDCVEDNCQEHPDTSTQNSAPHPTDNTPYHLILRKYLPNLNPALEFRCFVRNRTLLCLCQRDLNHFAFLSAMRDQLRSRIQSFFDEKLRNTFPDENFVFDVYVPEPHTRVWLIDINPWAPRTDPLLFSWLEILTLPDLDSSDVLDVADLTIQDRHHGRQVSNLMSDDTATTELPSTSSSSSSSSSISDSQSSTLLSLPEFRLVAKDDPEAYSFNTPRYSAHKLPRDVVDAAANGDVEGEGGLREFVGVWKDVLARRRRDEDEEG